MNLDDYKNITALFTPLKTFLAEQDKQVKNEDTHLKQEEEDVTNEQNLLNTHPCPCVWGQWTTWSSCSKTCGGGTINRSRNITQQAKNAGDSCAGSSTQQMSCNPDPCRKRDKVVFLSQMKFACSLQPFTVLGDCGGNGLPAQKLVGMAS